MTVLDDTGDITELEKFSPERVDAVDFPATGLGFLLLKRTGSPQAAPEEPTEKAVAPVDAPQDQAPETRPQDMPPAPEPEAEAPAEAAKSAAPDPGMVNVDIPAGASVSISPADLAKLATFKQQLVLREQAALAKDNGKPKPKPVGLTGAIKSKFVSDLADVGKNPTAHVSQWLHRCNEWASTGHYPTGLSYSDVRWMAQQCVKELKKRNPDSEASMDGFPAAKASKGTPAQDGVEKCQAGQAALTAAASDSEGNDTRKASAGEAAKAKARAKGGKKKPFPGAAPPFGAKDKGKDDAGDGAEDGGSGADGGGKAEKAGMSCKGCGGDMAKDAKFCANCGDAAGDKAEKSAACGCGEPMAKDARFCGACGKAASRAEKARACKCGCAMAKGQKFCTDCGEKAKAPKVAKAVKPFPADADVDAAISRLEGDAAAALDAQAKDPDNSTHPADAKVEAELERVKADVEAAAAAQAEDERTDTAAGHEAKKSAPGGGVPYHLQRLHDATCAAYRHEDVVIAHPVAAKGIGELVDPQAFAQMTQAALADDGGTGSRAHEIPALSAAFQHAVTLKSLAAGGALDEAMEDVRKAFSEYYPDAHPSPGSVSPGEFRRPYVSAGRANQAAKPGQEPRIPLSSHVPEASDFRRPLITAGREAASPGSNPKPSGVGKARQYYTNAARDGAAAALTQMHDWIADNHPGVCAMTGSTYDGEPGQAGSMGSSLTTAKPVPAQMTLTRDKASPVPVSATAAAAAVTPSVTKAERKAAAKAARKAAEMAQAQQAPAAEAAPAVSAVDPELLKGMLREVVAEGLGDVIKSVGDLGDRVAAMESAPDPAQMAPRSGAGVAKAQDKDREVPAGGDGFEVERIARLVKRAKDPDSGVRTTAIGELFEMVPREAAVQLLEAAY